MDYLGKGEVLTNTDLDRFTDMQSWEEQSQGAIYTVEYACSAVKSMTNSSLYFKNIDGLLRQAISLKEQISSSQGRRL
uniref:Uncharacterized protein n=1 Tax=Sinocyclocheilus rhinocerous TaxID=307959 RepID=A0A673IE69_9TELE